MGDAKRNFAVIKAKKQKEDEDKPVKVQKIKSTRPFNNVGRGTIGMGKN